MMARAILLPGLLLLAVAALHLTVGAAPVPLRVVVAALTAYDPSDHQHVVVVLQRLTRLVVAVHAGAVLAVAGLLLQKIMQNGLVSPSTLGINSGATAFVVASVYFLGLSGSALFLPALCGGSAAIALTFLTSRLLGRGEDRRLTLVLAGSMVGVLFSSASTFLIALDPDSFGDLKGWLVGDIGNFDYIPLQSLFPIGVLCLIAAFLLSRAVDLILLGEEQAAVLGVEVRTVYGATLAVAILLAVSAVAVVGPIGFVGLVVPHIARILFGESGRPALWACLFGGPVALVLADTLARWLLAPKLLNVGTIMGLAGGAVFLALLLFALRRRPG